MKPNHEWNSFVRHRAANYQVQVGTFHGNADLEDLMNCDEACAKQVCANMAGCQSFAMCTGGGGDTCDNWKNRPRFYTRGADGVVYNNGWSLWVKEFDDCAADSHCDSHTIASAVDALCPPDSILVSVDDAVCSSGTESNVQLGKKPSWSPMTSTAARSAVSLAGCITLLSPCMGCAAKTIVSHEVTFNASGGICMSCGGVLAAAAYGNVCRREQTFFTHLVNLQMREDDRRYNAELTRLSQVGDVEEGVMVTGDTPGLVV